jgi:hypothetical protein
VQGVASSNLAVPTISSSVGVSAEEGRVHFPAAGIQENWQTEPDPEADNSILTISSF